MEIWHHRRGPRWDTRSDCVAAEGAGAQWFTGAWGCGAAQVHGGRGGVLERGLPALVPGPWGWGRLH